MNTSRKAMEWFTSFFHRKQKVLNKFLKKFFKESLDTSKHLNISDTSKFENESATLNLRLHYNVLYIS